MKRFKKVLFGYSKEDVDALVESYEKIIKTKDQDIEYLKQKLEKNKVDQTLMSRDVGEGIVVAEEVAEDISRTINK